MPEIAFHTTRTIPAETFTGTSVTHTSSGVVWNFASSVEYGYYWNGDIFVVSNGADVVITSITPASTDTFQHEDEPGVFINRTVHGTMVQPGQEGAEVNGFDSVTYAYPYDAPSNDDPGVTGSNLVIDFATYSSGASVVKAKSLLDFSDRIDRSSIDKFSILTVVPEVPPANAFRPPVVGTDKTSYYTTDHLDFSKLKNVTPVAGQAPVSDYAYLAEATQVSWIRGRTFVRAFHPDAYRTGYNDYYYERDLIPAKMALHSNYTDAEKLPVYAGIVQQGLDFGAYNLVLGVWLSDSTHIEIFPPMIAWAAIALDSQEMRDALLVSKDDPNNANESADNFFYVAAEHLGVNPITVTSSEEPNFDSGYEASQVGLPEWRLRKPYRDSALDASYRDINSNNVPIAALLMDMLGDGTEARAALQHPEYFDYAERARLIFEIRRVSHAHSLVQGDFLAAYHATYSQGATMNFPPEKPRYIEVTPSGSTLSVDAGAWAVWPGSSPVTRVDCRYCLAADKAAQNWTQLDDVGGTAFDITGLASGLYYVQVRLHNQYGAGPWSNNKFKRGTNYVSQNTYLKDALIAEGYFSEGQSLDFAYADGIEALWDGSAAPGNEAIIVDYVRGTAIIA